MSRKRTELSISDKWSLDEQLGAALRELDGQLAHRSDDEFRAELLALIQQYDVTVDTVITWCWEGMFV